MNLIYSFLITLVNIVQGISDAISIALFQKTSTAYLIEAEKAIKAASTLEEKDAVVENFKRRLFYENLALSMLLVGSLCFFALVFHIAHLLE